MRVVAWLLLAALTAGCSVLSIDLSPRIRPLQEETVEGSGDDKILLMDVSGFLSDESTSSLLNITAPPARVPLLVRVREELKKAQDDPKVKALVLRINTPGGTVTGSIGVIMLSFNAEGLMQKLGVAATAIKSAERKDMGSPFRALTAEERAIFQSVIDELYRQFVAKVVERRKLPEATARGLGDGRVYTAEQALGHRLVDRIGYMPDAVDIARRAAGVDKARVIVYHRPRQYRATYYAEAQQTEGGFATGSAMSALGAMVGPGPKFLYLWLP